MFRINKENFTWLVYIPIALTLLYFFIANFASYQFVTLGYSSAILLDLDFFKKVNDTHGHEAGNDVLKQVADILQTFNDESRFVARYGGEEFVVLLKDYEKEEALSVAENIRKEIAETNFKVHHSIKTEQPAELNVTASLGLATYPNDCSDIYELMTVADYLMYSGSKQKGRNRVTAMNEEGYP